MQLKYKALHEFQIKQFNQPEKCQYLKNVLEEK